MKFTRAICSRFQIFRVEAWRQQGHPKARVARGSHATSLNLLDRLRTKGVAVFAKADREAILPGPCRGQIGTIFACLVAAVDAAAGAANGPDRV